MNLPTVNWERIRFHQMKPVKFAPGRQASCTITHRNGEGWHDEEVVPFFAHVRSGSESRLAYLCKARDGSVYPFIPDGNLPPERNGIRNHR